MIEKAAKATSTATTTATAVAVGAAAENLLRRRTIEIHVKPSKSGQRENVHAENRRDATRWRRESFFVNLTKCQIPVHATLAKNVPVDRRVSEEANPHIQALNAFASMLAQLMNMIPGIIIIAPLPKATEWKQEFLNLR